MADEDRLAELLSAGEGHYSLAEACLLIAGDAYPGLDVNHYLAEIERMAARLRGRLAQGADGEEKVVALNQYLFNELGFYGNADDYYDPRNSVSFPGHFLVRLSLRGGTLVLDPFSGGEPLSEPDLRKILRRVIAGSGSAGLRSAAEVAAELPLDPFLEVAGPRQILVRVLRNLKNIYLKKDAPERQLQVIQRMITVAPEAHGELRDRGVLYQRMEAFRAALKDLTEYLEREPEAADAEEVRGRIIELTALCARLN